MTITDILLLHVTQHTFGTRFMRQVIFNHHINEFRTYLFISQRVCTVYFGAKDKNEVILTHISQRKHAFLGEIKEMSKTKKLPARKIIALELLHQRLGHSIPSQQ